MTTSVLSFAFSLGLPINVYNVKKYTQNLNPNYKIKAVSTSLSDVMNSSSITVRNNSYFSSLISKEVTVSQENLGYYTTSVAALSESSNLVADSLMGYKYYLSSKQINRPYLKLVDGKDNVYVYENTLSTTGAVFVDKNYSYDDKLNSFENLEKLKNTLNVSGKLFDEIEFNAELIEDFDKNYSASVIKYSYTATANSVIYINQEMIDLENETNKEHKMYFEKRFNDEKYFVVGEFAKTDIYNDLLYLENGETVQFYICATDIKKEDLSKIKFKVLNYDIAEQVCLKLQDSQAEITYLKDGYIVDVDNKQGRLVVFAPNLKDMSYMVDNVEINADNEFGYFASFDVAEGSKQIVAKYSFSASKLWIIISIVCLVLVVLIAILYHKTKFKFLEKIMRMTFIVASLVILLIFGVFGIILTFFRFWL